MKDERFSKVFDLVVKSQAWQKMLAIREDSKWHREENVAEHTRMVAAWYNDNLANSRTPHQQYLTRLALLFHDFGKPHARTEKFSEERGVYYSYPGHEKFSARLFLDFYMAHREGFEPFSSMTWDEVRTVQFMIEYHLPYETMKVDKLANIKRDIMWQGESVLQMFFDVLQSDAHGRISDDPEGTYARVGDWIEKFSQVEVSPIPPMDNTKPHLVVLIGASGSGKSTFCANSDYEVFSLDKMRHDYFWFMNQRDAEYDEAWQYCVDNESGYNEMCMKVFVSMVKLRQDIVLDTVNATAKSRRKWLTVARHAGYNITAVEFPIALQTVLDRQQTRPDKTVPASSVKQQYLAIALPLMGSEVDEIVVA